MYHNSAKNAREVRENELQFFPVAVIIKKRNFE
jgi:hypothetical protein